MPNQKHSQLASIIESILLISGDGINLDAIAEKLCLDNSEIKQAIKELQQTYSGESGIHLVNYNNKVQFSSNPEYAIHVEAVLNPIREKALTKATLETLAIVAYKQPVTRLEIEQIRGVGSDYAVQVLVEHNLIEVMGRKDTPGKPLLFGTTDEFLKRFDISCIEELPNQADLMERIALIKQETSNSLYHDFKLQNLDEEALAQDAEAETSEQIELPTSEEELSRFEAELERELKQQGKLEQLEKTNPAWKEELLANLIEPDLAEPEAN